MHATERERLIIEAMGPNGFVSYRDLEARLAASPATIRRDLSRLEEEGVIHRVRGGAKLSESHGGRPEGAARLAGTPFAQSITEHLAQKQAIGHGRSRRNAWNCSELGRVAVAVRGFERDGNRKPVIGNRRAMPHSGYRQPATGYRLPATAEPTPTTKASSLPRLRSSTRIPLSAPCASRRSIRL